MQPEPAKLARGVLPLSADAQAFLDEELYKAAEAGDRPTNDVTADAFWEAQGRSARPPPFHFRTQV